MRLSLQSLRNRVRDDPAPRESAVKRDGGRGPGERLSVFLIRFSVFRFPRVAGADFAVCSLRAKTKQSIFDE